MALVICLIAAGAVVLSIALTILDYGGIISLPRTLPGLLTSIRLAAESELRQRGPIPRHMAFIMDGNRRFARGRLQNVEEGHLQGAIILTKVLKLCYSLGIDTVTVFAFSMDNFSRKPSELKSVFSILEDRVGGLLSTEHGFSQSGLRIRVVGNISRFPEGLQNTLNRVSDLTRNNKSNTLNLCCAYTSRDEILDAIRFAASGIENNSLYSNDVNDEFINSLMQASRSWEIDVRNQDSDRDGSTDASENFEDTVRDVDVLIRTSGEYRVSDFLTWQISDRCLIQFFDRYWPEFGTLDFFVSVLDYQRYFFSSRKRQPHTELPCSFGAARPRPLFSGLDFGDLTGEDAQSARLRIHRSLETLTGG